MIKNYEDSTISYFMVQSVPQYEEPEPEEDYEKEARFLRLVNIALGILLIISMLTTVWVMI